MRYRNLVLSASVLFLTPFAVLGDTATQTDWSGGNDALGPVSDWGNEFFESSGMYFAVPSDITIIRHISFTPAEHTVDGDFDGARSVYSADIDNDGDMDMLGAAVIADDITWWENTDGTGTAWTEHTIDVDFDGACSVYSADIDNDGDMDVLGAAVTADDITWWENTDGTGTAWTENTIDANFNGARSVYSADIDNDGDMDVLGAAYFANEITWWENSDTSPGVFLIEHTIDGDYYGANSVCSSDIDTDGDMDVIGTAASTTLNDITWWENTDGTGTAWTEHTIDGDFNDAVSSCSSDFDDDGDMDVVGAAENTLTLTWWENADSSGTAWTEHIIDENFNAAVSVYSTDIDSDDFIDVLGASWSQDVVTVWKCINGSGTAWFEYPIDENFMGAISVYSTDINNDGYMDVLGAAEIDNDITWWDPWWEDYYYSSASLTSSILDADLADSDSWTYLDWNSTEPSGTHISIQVRASDDSLAMGLWSSHLTSPCSLSTILDDGDRYFQYVVNCYTDSLAYTPTLHDVTVEWTEFVAIEEESGTEITSYALYCARPNPAFGHTTLVFSLPLDSRADLTVYDLAGRMVYSVSDDYSAGIHEVILEGFASGVYLVRLTSADFTATMDFVMID